MPLLSLGLGLGLKSPGGATDPDALSFFNRAGITDLVQQSAVNGLVLDLKAAGIWSKMIVLDPFVGGTAATHSHNLISASYQITWNGALTHNAQGVKGDGATSYGDANFIPSTSGLLLNSTHFSCYINQADTVGGCQMGGPSAVVNVEQFQYFQNVGGSTLMDVHGTTTGRIMGVPPANTGFFVGSRTAANAVELYRNGTSYATSAGASESLTGFEVFLLARNASGVTVPTDARLALLSIGLGLSALEVAAFNAAVQRFQTALGR